VTRGAVMAQDHARGKLCRCRSGADHLTDRELDVLLLVAAGRHNNEIAKVLGISTRTVDHHLRTMLRRAGVQSRVELVARCYAAEIMVAGTWPPAWSGTRCLAGSADLNTGPLPGCERLSPRAIR
jgi:DNA-binding CsgD family transcriptional regulator